MPKSLLLATLCLTAVVSAQTPTPKPSPTKPARTETDANNTARNAGDGAKDASTADRQPNGAADLKILQAIRKAVIAEPSLSIGAKNCKIIVREGSVILRGPVASAEERTRIGNLALRSVPAGKVVNALEVKRAGR